MALTFLLVLLTLATLCTRLHRNFRRGESIYWEPTVDSRDTVAGETWPSSPPAPPHSGQSILTTTSLPQGIPRPVRRGPWL